MGRVIGIDFGTTKTVVAVMENGRPIVIPDRNGHLTMPSLVLVTPEQELFVGWEAQNHPQRYQSQNITINSIKRILGKDGERTWGWWKTQPIEVGALILGRIKILAEEYLGEPINDALIATPAHFDINQRWAIKQAAKIAGINVLRLVNEATAAAITHRTVNSSHEANVLAFDFGGGTLDISVLNIGERVCEVVATVGDGRLGGDDFDQVICNYLLKSAQKQFGESLQFDQTQSTVIREAACQAKIDLTAAESTHIRLPGFLRSAAGSYQDLDVALDRRIFNELSEQLLTRTEKLLRRALSEAEKRGPINAALLIGGSSRIPAVREIVRKVVGQEPQGGVDSDTGVAQGAAILGGILKGDVNNILLLDVFPNVLSVASADGLLLPLIDKNTCTPTRKSKIFTTTKENQSEISFSLYEGEGKFIKDDVLIGQVTLSGITPAASGEPKIEVTVDIDANNIVNVTAEDLDTHKNETVYIKAPFQLNPAQITVMTKKVAQELNEIKERLVKQEKHFEAEELKDLHQQVASRIRSLLDGNLLNPLDSNLSILEAGAKLATDYFERGATVDQMKQLLSAIQHELHKILSDLIVGKVSPLAEDAFLAVWACKTANQLNSDETILAASKQFADHYDDVIRSIFEILTTGFERLSICDMTFARLEESPRLMLWFALALNHLKISFDLARCVTCGTNDDTSKSLLLILLLRLLSNDTSPSLRVAAAQTLAKMKVNACIESIFTRIVEETDEKVAAAFREGLDLAAAETLYGCFKKADLRTQTFWKSCDYGKTRLKNVLSDILPTKESNEQKWIIGTLAELIGSEDLPTILTFLDSCNDKDLRCKLITNLPRMKDDSIVAPLLKFMCDEETSISEVAGRALSVYFETLPFACSRFSSLAFHVFRKGHILSWGERAYLWRLAGQYPSLRKAIDMLRERGKA